MKKESPIHNNTVKKDIPTRYRPQIIDYEPQFIEPHYEQYPYWNDDLYDQRKLEDKRILNKSPEEIEEDDIITDSPVSDKPRYALNGLWTANPLLPIFSQLLKFGTSINFIKNQKSVIDTKSIPQLQ